MNVWTPSTILRTKRRAPFINEINKMRLCQKQAGRCECTAAVTTNSAVKLSQFSRSLAESHGRDIRLAGYKSEFNDRPPPVLIFSDNVSGHVASTCAETCFPADRLFLAGRPSATSLAGNSSEIL